LAALMPADDPKEPGPGKFETPLERMHAAYCPSSPPDDDPPVPRAAAGEAVVVVPMLATPAVGEPPHAAVARARPTRAEATSKKRRRHRVGVGPAGDILKVYAQRILAANRSPVLAGFRGSRDWSWGLGQSVPNFGDGFNRGRLPNLASQPAQRDGNGVGERVGVLVPHLGQEILRARKAHWARIRASSTANSLPERPRRRPSRLAVWCNGSFPDPSAQGIFDSSRFDESSAAFQTASTACERLRPAGPTPVGPGHGSAGGLP
jgi:hypothetical protein